MPDHSKWTILDNANVILSLPFQHFEFAVGFPHYGGQISYFQNWRATFFRHNEKQQTDLHEDNFNDR